MERRLTPAQRPRPGIHEHLSPPLPPYPLDMRDEIVRVPDDEVDGEEEWVRETDDDDVLGVDAVKLEDADEWPWQVTIAVAEFVREDPLEDELRREMDAALRAVPGVADVEEEDREVWIVNGQPSARTSFGRPFGSSIA